MNPFEKDGNGYLVVCSVFALAYAFLTGNLSAGERLVDGAVYGILLLLAGMMLWSIFRYALSGDLPPLYRNIFSFLISLLATLCVVGIETAVLYFCFPESFGETLASLPLRLFITLLGLIIFWLYGLLPATEKPAAEPTVPVGPPPEPVPAPTAAVERITVRNGQKIKIISVEEILYLQAEGDYVSIRTVEGRWLKEQTMKYSEEILPADRFVRIHRSYIVNITHISRIERYGEQQSVILHNGERIRISATRYQLLRRRLDI
ncbi:MAG: LytTR family transcriptional regulator DNA-binding domain-containing protein [Tannerella sp.]|jgi:hypothetical protein|nr:LytTR family transcriptional regulator DNA-binding domain-containing protein [Tannerella sp.]